MELVVHTVLMTLLMLVVVYGFGVMIFVLLMGKDKRNGDN